MRCAAGVFGFVLLWHFTFAQSYFYKENIIEPDWLVEAGAFLGLMNCHTDLGGKKGSSSFAIDYPASRPAMGMFAMATYRHTVGFRIQYLNGSIGAADSLIGSGLAGSRYDRNLHFQSRINEINLLVELFPFGLTPGNLSASGLQPFIQAGAGWFWFNPQAKILNRWEDLQPLHTEGQGWNVAEKVVKESYALAQFNLPVGLGIRWEAGPFMHLRVEGLYRILFTDYLDDVSTSYVDPQFFTQYLPPGTASKAEEAADRRRSIEPFQQGTIRGNPSKNDAYFHLQLSVSVLLNRKKIN